MTQETIALAKKAGLHIATDVNWMPIIGLEYAEKLIALIRADEREACAKLCESLPMQQEIDVRDQCAAAIRARGQA
jgi:hypothetical protein